MTAAYNRPFCCSRHALEAAIHRAYAIGRVDQALGVAAEELRRMVAAQPGLTPWRVLQLYGEPAVGWFIPDWDHALWRLADVWCDLHRGLQGRPARQSAASPYTRIIEIPDAAMPEATAPALCGDAGRIAPDGVARTEAAAVTGRRDGQPYFAAWEVAATSR
jgi:hypothetical protein